MSEAKAVPTPLTRLDLGSTLQNDKAFKALTVQLLALDDKSGSCPEKGSAHRLGLSGGTATERFTKSEESQPVFLRSIKAIISLLPK